MLLPLLHPPFPALQHFLWHGSEVLGEAIRAGEATLSEAGGRTLLGPDRVGRAQPDTVPVEGLGPPLHKMTVSSGSPTSINYTPGIGVSKTVKGKNQDSVA